MALLRRGLAALARAFAHASREGDARLLGRAAGASPLVHWAMRYAAAIVAVDRGRAREVQALLSGAPAWPEESAFHAYHEELLARAGARNLVLFADTGALAAFFARAVLTAVRPLRSVLARKRAHRLVSDENHRGSFWGLYVQRTGAPSAIAGLCRRLLSDWG